MKKLKHYKIYDFDDYDNEENNFSICLEHPQVEDRTLCGQDPGSTPDGNPIETNEKINCRFCLETIKQIENLLDAWKNNKGIS
jgi:hypothetical protein